jgi:hypothetical protein
MANPMRILFKEMMEDKEIASLLSELDEVRTPVFTLEIIQKISQLADMKRIDTWAVADGTVGLFRYEKDGNAYEIEVRPISQGKHKDLWKDKIKKKDDREAPPKEEEL